MLIQNSKAITLGVLVIVIVTAVYFDTAARMRNGHQTFEEVQPVPMQLRQHLPNCILFGVQKGGTGALIEFLDLHPDIVVQHHETHFFDYDDRYSRGLDYYKSLMPLSFPNQVIIEKTPDYFHTEDVARRIHEMNSSLKLLLAVRNPVTRMLSQYAMALKNHPDFPPVRHLIFDPQGNVNSKILLFNMSTYHIHFSRWLKYFPRNNIHIINSEKFTRNPYKELVKIERFLGIGHKISKQRIYFDSQRGFYCMLKNNESTCLPPSKGLKHPDLSGDEIDKLRKYFKPLNEQFFKVAGRRFKWK